MSNYVYACEDETHPRITLTCRMSEVDSVTIICKECGKEMHRVPQPFMFGQNHRLTMIEWGKRNFQLYRAGKPRIPYPE